MKHQYSGATTRRYVKWREACVEAGEYDPPLLDAIENWLRVREDYRDSIGAVRNLCDGLRETGGDTATLLLQQIACALASDLEKERAFASKAEEFFSAAIRRVGVDADEVRILDAGFRAVCTLHDLGLAKKETADA